MRRPQRSTLFPYTTLFRSQLADRISGIGRGRVDDLGRQHPLGEVVDPLEDRKSTRLNSSHRCISYAVFCLKKKKKQIIALRRLRTVPDGVAQWLASRTPNC